MELRNLLNINEDNFKNLIQKNTMVDDIIIANFLRIIEFRSIIINTLPKVFSFDSFFFLALNDGGFNRVKKWNKTINLYKKDYIFIPVHFPKEKHWCLIQIMPKKQIIRSYDSLGKSRLYEVNLVKKYMINLANELNLTTVSNSWSLFYETETIKQAPNSLDCGIFVIYYCERLSLNLDIVNFNTTLYRKKIASVLRWSNFIKPFYFIDKEDLINLFIEQKSPLLQTFENNYISFPQTQEIKSTINSIFARQAISQNEIDEAIKNIPKESICIEKNVLLLNNYNIEHVYDLELSIIETNHAISTIINL